MDDGSDFVATATGAISPKAKTDDKSTMDQWSINKDRQLINSVDGVN
jgi:hypothetical protein